MAQVSLPTFGYLITRNPESHKNKVLLINAAKDEYVQPMRKNLGMKMSWSAITVEVK